MKLFFCLGYKSISFILFLIIILFSTGSRAQNVTTVFKLANVLQSNMVVQQAKPFKLWGMAPAGDVIEIHADWTSKTITTKADEQGKWIGNIAVPAIKAGNFTPHIITVIHKSDKLTLSNILIGDVWFCAGQSNMDMMVRRAQMLTYPGVLNYEQEIADAKFPAIRLYKANADFKINPVWDTKGTWKICSPETVGDFSGVAYFFGRELFLKLNIPIGLVVSAVPGASTQAFTKREILESDTMLKRVYFDPSAKLISSQHSVDSTGFFAKVTKPVLIYNAIIYPMFNLSIKGMIWYQGESNNADKQSTYIPLFTAMLADWRKDFKQGDFPFYYTQIAPYKDAFNDSTANKEAHYRETQEKLLSIKNTGIAITMDVGMPKVVHLPDKKSVGQRLAYNALYKTYHFKNVPYLGPQFSTYKVDGNIVTVSFKPESIASGLTTKDGQAPKHFYLAGSDYVFYEAQAKIAGNTVVINSDKVAKPIAIRYAFKDAEVTNLQNKAGLPAMPFRTDNLDK